MSRAVIIIALAARAALADPLLFPQVGHANAVDNVALSPDGALAATSSKDAIVLWDVRSGMQIHRLTGIPGTEHWNEAPQVAFSYDGKSLVAVTSGLVTLFAVGTWKSTWQASLISVRFNGPRGLVVSDDGERFAYRIRGAGSNSAVFVGIRSRTSYPADTVSPRIIDAETELSAMAFAPTGDRVATGAKNGVVTIWSVENTTAVAARQFGSAEIDHVTFVRDTPYVIATAGAELVMWDPTTNEIVASARTPAFDLGSIRVEGDVVHAIGTLRIGDGFAHAMWEITGSSRAPVAPWGLAREQLRLGKTPGRAMWIARAARAPVALVTEGDDATVVRTSDGVVLAQLDMARLRRAEPVQALALDGNGRIAYVMRSGRLVRLDLATFASRELAELHDAKPREGLGERLALCADDRTLLQVDTEGVRVIAGLDKPEPTVSVLADTRGATAATFDPTCSTIAVARRQGDDVIVETRRRDGTLVHRLAHPHRYFFNGNNLVEVRRSGPSRYRMNKIELYGDLETIGGRAASADNQWTVTRASAKYVEITGSAKLSAGAADVIVGLALSADGKTLTLTGELSGRVERWDLDTATMLSEADAPARTVVIRFDGRLAAGKDDNTMVAWDPGTRVSTPIRGDGHTAGITRVALASRARRALTASDDGTLRLWNLDSGESLAIVTSGEDWFAWTPDGYFEASPRGIDLLAVVDGAQAYGVERIAAERERPDLLLQRMGLATAEIRRGLAVRAEQRRRGSPIKTANDPPRVTIASARRDGAFLELELGLATGGAPIAAYEIAVNGVPLHTGAITTARAAATTRVALSHGTNRISVRARDTRGVESIEAIATTHLDTETARDLYVVAFGVSRYERPELRLEYAASDASAIATELLALRGNGFREVHATTFLDDEVTPAALDRARAFLAPARIDDVVVLFVGGHGVLDPVTSKYYYLPVGADPDRIADTAISFEALESLSYASASRHKLVLMDTCDSGEAEAAPLASARRASIGDARPKGLVRIARTSASGGPVAIPGAYRRSSLFREAFRRSGAVVLSSSRGSESSWESPKLRAGLFTHAVIAALRSPATDRDGNGQISAIELERRVAADVARLSLDAQHPSIDRDNPQAHVALPVLPPTQPPIPRAMPPHGCGCSGSAPTGVLVALVVLRLGRRRRATASSRSATRAGSSSAR